MCLICNRISLINDGKNPYFIKELDTGYVVIGDHQYFRGYTTTEIKKKKYIFYFFMFIDWNDSRRNCCPLYSAA